MDGTETLEDVDNTTDREPRRETNQKMDMVLAHMKSRYLNIVSLRYLTEGFLKARPNLAQKNGAAAFGSPNQVIPAVVNTVRGATHCHTHVPVQTLGHTSHVGLS